MNRHEEDVEAETQDPQGGQDPSQAGSRRPEEPGVGASWGPLFGASAQLCIIVIYGTVYM